MRSRKSACRAHDIPLALLLFNVGVEIGQLLFIAAASLALWGVARLIASTAPVWTRLATPYAIGGFACVLVHRTISARYLTWIHST